MTFLFVGSSVCRWLPSDPSSRKRPCLKLGVIRHSAPKVSSIWTLVLLQGTFTPLVHTHAGRTQDPQQRAIKQADLDMLIWAAAAGDIDLGYLDESGFSLWSPVSYSYFFVGEQKYLEQTKRRDSRVSILGIWQPSVRFAYGLVKGGFNSLGYIKMMDAQAKAAAAVFEQTGRIRVIAQDCGPIHTSLAVQAKLAEWETQGLYVFYFAKYCSEMNPIELEWQRLKEDEIAGRMFEYELDLAYAVIDAVEARAKAGGYTAERFKFHQSQDS